MNLVDARGWCWCDVPLCEHPHPLAEIRRAGPPEDVKECIAALKEAIATANAAQEAMFEARRLVFTPLVPFQKCRCRLWDCFECAQRQDAQDFKDDQEANMDRHTIGGLYYERRGGG